MEHHSSSRTEHTAGHGEPHPTLMERTLTTLPHVIVQMLAFFFLIVALMYAIYAAVEFIHPIIVERDFLKGLVKGLHSGVVALAVYELAQVVYQEHDQGRPQNVIIRIRRGVARFGSVVFVALVIESLIMVIKYSQQDLAGFLYYPAALIVSAAALLVSLGLFTRFTAAATGRHD